jgi:hypothetical protein
MKDTKPRFGWACGAGGKKKEFVGDKNKVCVPSERPVSGPSLPVERGFWFLFLLVFMSCFS